MPAIVSVGNTVAGSDDAEFNRRAPSLPETVVAMPPTMVLPPGTVVSSKQERVPPTEKETRKGKKKRRLWPWLAAGAALVIIVVLVIVGAVNWGLVGLFQFDLVAALFGPASALSRGVARGHALQKARFCRHVSADWGLYVRNQVIHPAECSVRLPT